MTKKTNNEDEHVSYVHIKVDPEYAMELLREQGYTFKTIGDTVYQYKDGENKGVFGHVRK